MIRSIFNKLFIGGEWKAAYRKRSDAKGAFQLVPTNEDFWIADPFWVEDQGEHYLFCEVYQKKAKHGGIGYYKMINGEPVYQGMVIQNPYHMSYPCVFTYSGKFYMIPETGANQTIELYRAEQFPNKWRLDKILLKGERYADSTVYQSDDRYYLLSYQKRNAEFSLTLFSLDMEKKELTKVGEKLYSKNIGRPAGSLFHEKESLMRPAQNCKGKYGEGLCFYRVTKLDERGIEEEEIAYISVNQILAKGKFQRVHTYNRDSAYEVVDLFREKFDMFHAVKILRRRNSARAQ